VLILKEVKVIYFDTLLQVLILKGLRIARKLCKFASTQSGETNKKAARWNDKPPQNLQDAPLTECYYSRLVSALSRKKVRRSNVSCLIRQRHYQANFPNSSLGCAVGFLGRPGGAQCGTQYTCTISNGLAEQENGRVRTDSKAGRFPAA